MPSQTPIATYLDAPADRFRLALAARIGGARRDAGITQAQLAEALGIPRSNVAAWEQAAALPPLHLVSSLSAALRIDLATLLGPPSDREASLRPATRRGRPSAREERTVEPTGRALADTNESTHERPPAHQAPKPSAPYARQSGEQDPDASVVRAVPSVSQGSAQQHLYPTQLERPRATLARRATLQPGEARALASFVSRNHYTAAPDEALARVKEWAASPASALPPQVAAYFRRVERLGEEEALACVVALAYSATEDSSEARVGRLLDLLGDPDL